MTWNQPAEDPALARVRAFARSVRGQLAASPMPGGEHQARQAGAAQAGMLQQPRPVRPVRGPGMPGMPGSHGPHRDNLREILKMRMGNDPQGGQVPGQVTSGV